MKISDEIQEKIREDYKTGQYSYAALAAKYGVSGTSVGRIIKPDYRERERARNKARKYSYNSPKPEHSMLVRFYKKDQALIKKVKSVPNVQQYVKDLIEADIEKENNK